MDGVCSIHLAGAYILNGIGFCTADILMTSHILHLSFIMLLQPINDDRTSYMKRIGYGWV
jgi:hypothetical protein